ncbi:MAG: hypothetical protein TECD_00690 [Hyphomicrobiaceae bacterium hypho_1]
MLFPESDHELIISVRELKLKFFVGVLAEEKLAKQLVVINIWMSTFNNARHISDDINAYASYTDVIDSVKRLSIEGCHIELLETLAEKIACLALQDNRVARVVVSVDKPDIIPQVERVGVVIRRSR